MTPKEKAKELIDKYSFVEIANYTSMFEVKQCALITCNEVLGYMGADRGYSFWLEVKQEIEKL